MINHWAKYSFEITYSYRSSRILSRIDQLIDTKPHSSFSLYQLNKKKILQINKNPSLNSSLPQIDTHTDYQDNRSIIVDDSITAIVQINSIPYIIAREEQLSRLARYYQDIEAA